MHPALSVIFFTTLSGFGYGLAFWLAVDWIVTAPSADDPWFGGLGLAAGLGAVAGGLLSSTAHLGHPERAWRAFSQWRSSWLSREGVAAVLSLPPLAALWLAWIGQADGAVWTVVALLGAVLAAATVFCTGMIYQSLKPIAAWRSKLTTPVYLLYAAATGAYGAGALGAWFGHADDGRLVLTLALTVGLAAAKRAYWKRARTATATTPESATGLGRFGTVRQLEAPHVTANYITREMGFRVARKHAEKLRLIALTAGLAAPFLLGAVALAAPGFAAVGLTLAALAAFAGAVVERWLFFAEAKHAVTSFYGG